MTKTYRPSWIIGLVGVAFAGGAVAMFVTQVILVPSQDAVLFSVFSLIFFLVGVALLLYVANSKTIVEPEGLVFKNMLGQETSRIPWPLISRVTTATEERTDSDGRRYRTTGYYVQAAGLGLVPISCANIQGLIRDIEAHSSQVRNDPFSTHTYNPPSQSVLNDDMGS